MPLTKKGRKIKAAMVSEYGAKKGTSVFYASINKGKIKGAEAGGKVRSGEQARQSYIMSGMSGGAAVAGGGQGYGGKVMHPMAHAKSRCGGRWS